MPTDYAATLPMGPNWRAKYTPQGYAPPGWTQPGEQAYTMQQEQAMGRQGGQAYPGNMGTPGMIPGGIPNAPRQATQHPITARMDQMTGTGNMVPPFTSSAGFAPNISTGISVGPVLPPDVVAAQRQQITGATPNVAGMAPGAAGRVQEMFGQQMQAYDTEYDRNASYANAQQLLATQKARAGAGAGWGGIAAGNYASQLSDQSRMVNALLALLGQFAG